MCPTMHTTRKTPVEQLVSAGGVVIKDISNGPQVILCGRISPPVWALPKGTPEMGETREETALREGLEETGLEVKTECYIDSVQYWFSSPSTGTPVHKKVLFYLMSPIGGDTSMHDNEFDDVKWFPADEALKLMTYGNEAKVVSKGLSLALQI